MPEPVPDLPQARGVPGSAHPVSSERGEDRAWARAGRVLLVTIGQSGRTLPNDAISTRGLEVDMKQWDSVSVGIGHELFRFGLGRVARQRAWGGGAQRAIHASKKSLVALAAIIVASAQLSLRQQLLPDRHRWRWHRRRLRQLSYRSQSEPESNRLWEGRSRARGASFGRDAPRLRPAGAGGRSRQRPRSATSRALRYAQQKPVDVTAYRSREGRSRCRPSRWPQRRRRVHRGSCLRPPTRRRSCRPRSPPGTETFRHPGRGVR